MVLLAFIGLIAVFWLLQKGFSKASTFFFNLSEECFDYFAVIKRRQVEADKALQHFNKNVAEVIQYIKEKPNDPFNDRSETCSFYENFGTGKVVLLHKKTS